MKTANSKIRRGVWAFTLIELLVVISIIMILAGIIFAAASAAMRLANKNKAVAEAKLLYTAIMQYYNEYGKYPAYCGDGSTELVSQAEVVSVLLGNGLTDATTDGISATCAGANGSANPKKINYLSLSTKDLRDNFFIDPYKISYNIGMDTNYDNKISDLDSFFVGAGGLTVGSSLSPAWDAEDSTGTDVTIAAGAVVWSNGLDKVSGNGDYPTSQNPPPGGKDDIGTWNQ